MVKGGCLVFWKAAGALDKAYWNSQVCHRDWGAQFNTAIAQLMIFVRLKEEKLYVEYAKGFIAPFAPWLKNSGGQ